MQRRWLDQLSENALCALPWLFEFWAHPDHQLPPKPSDWRTWLILGGRGSGKTRAGAEWVRRKVEGATPLAKGQCGRIALVAETADQARDVMVLGESGLLACTPPDRRPQFQVSRRRLIWPNGAEAMLFSAKDPESLRGPQFEAAWCDELGKWSRAQAAWDMLQFAVRLGEHPQIVVTTTPRRNRVLFDLLEDPRCAQSHASTYQNAANLAPSFLAEIERRYGGTTLGRQEIEGEVLRELPGGLWQRAMFDAQRVTAAPPLDRIVVAVDPAASAHKRSDACGIIVAGRIAAADAEPARALVIADWSVQGASPQSWAERAVAAYHHHRADRLVAEVNQGGDMVETILRQCDPGLAFRPLHASRGKMIRAEPVAALYEQGRVVHLGALDRLEDEMCSLSRDRSQALRARSGAARSPDRVDALVWAITELLLTPSGAPRVRGL
ncbi:MAG: terminase family protein [Neomegalonema sp.]|nr:terminase family protein [Neomegalonema sp.]